MKRLMLIMALALLLASCVRRELTYSYNPTVEVVVRTDWSNMDEVPTGMTLYCYSEAGGSPSVVQTNNIDSVVLNLGVGSYRLLVFNQTPSDFSSVSFSGLDSYDTAEVYATTTKSNWYTSKSDESLVNNPTEIAASTFESIVIEQEVIDEVLGLREKYPDIDLDTYITINLKPKVVVKTTKVTVAVDGVHNLRSVRASLYGMATGYHFADQMSHSDRVTHLLESWSQRIYVDPTQGEVIAYFTCFGIPETTTTTRANVEEWDGMIYLDALLVDDSTIVSFDFELAGRTTIVDDEPSENSSSVSSNATAKADDDSADDDTDYSDVDADIDIQLGFNLVDDDDPIVLPDVDPTDAGEGGFSAEVEDWGDEENIVL